MRVRDIAVEEGPDPQQPVRLAATIDVDTDWLSDDPPFRVWYDFPAETADFIDPESADAFLAAFLLPAMRAGEPLELEGTISPRLYDVLTNFAALYPLWDQRYRPVDVAVQVRPVRDSPVGDRRHGLFFSHGLDSSYTLAKNLMLHPTDGDSLTHLLVVHGFDIYLRQAGRFPPLLNNVQFVGRPSKSRSGR